MDQKRLNAIINRIEADLERLSEAMASTQRTLKTLSIELKTNGEKVETVLATQRFLAGQKVRDGHGLYGRRAPREMEEE